ncbi:hypothetical protein BGX38DRAFT_244033 [Terfezia claveryi]|nr:hypothetical protein BGX38DRAFT_244033 [Terfezia claveryi]
MNQLYGYFESYAYTLELPSINNPGSTFMMYLFHNPAAALGLPVIRINNSQTISGAWLLAMALVLIEYFCSVLPGNLQIREWDIFLLLGIRAAMIFVLMWGLC